VVLLGTLAVAQSARRAHWHGRGMHGDRFGFFSGYLDLTDAQKAQAKDIMAKEKPAIQPLMQQLRQGRKQMMQLEQSGTFDEAQVRALASQQAQTMTELMVQKARIHSELYQLLTPEQKDKMQKFQAQREQRFKKFMQNNPDSTPENQ
jgi:protein CpxP